MHMRTRCDFDAWSTCNIMPRNCSECRTEHFTRVRVLTVPLYYNKITATAMEQQQQRRLSLHNHTN